MREAFAHYLGTALRLGENECALQNRLNEIADAFRAPWGIRRVELPCRLDIPRDDGDVARCSLIAGSPNVGMRGVGFLQQRAEEAGVVRQIAAQNPGTEIDVAE